MSNAYAVQSNSGVTEDVSPSLSRAKNASVRRAHFVQREMYDADRRESSQIFPAQDIVA
jgi:hypothetical protein